MNYIDFLLIIIVLLFVWNGWQSGFITGVINLVKGLGSIVTGLFFYQSVASFFQKYIPGLGVWTLPAALIVTIILARIILGLILNPIIKATPLKTHYNNFNKLLGIIPGFINGLITATIISALLLAFPLQEELSTATNESKIVNKLSPEIEWLNKKASPFFDKMINQTMPKLTVEPESNETVKLPYKVNNGKVREDLEIRMLELVNEERTKQGLKLLRFDPELREVARAHSKDMLARSYFSHYTPEGKDPFDRMKQAGVKFLVAGENLALAQTLIIAHDGLMNSPGHRANILRPSFGRCGIGVLDGGLYGLMISQEFGN